MLGVQFWRSSSGRMGFRRGFIRLTSWKLVSCCSERSLTLNHRFEAAKVGCIGTVLHSFALFCTVLHYFAQFCTIYFCMALFCICRLLFYSSIQHRFFKVVYCNALPRRAWNYSCKGLHLIVHSLAKLC